MVVNDEAQLYTLEGLSAALIMIVTMYLVLGTTSIYTPGDTHITDMQLEQIGSDVLEIMDSPNEVSGENELETYIRNWDNSTSGFKGKFESYLRNTAGLQSISSDDTLHFRATIFYVNKTGVVKSTPTFAETQSYNGREPAVKVTRLVSIEKIPGNTPTGTSIRSITDVGTDNEGDFKDKNRTVLLEVLLWRGGT